MPMTPMDRFAKNGESFASLTNRLRTALPSVDGLDPQLVRHLDRIAQVLQEMAGSISILSQSVGRGVPTTGHQNPPRSKGAPPT